MEKPSLEVTEQSMRRPRADDRERERKLERFRDERARGDEEEKKKSPKVSRGG
ncbi:hypothetical protein Syun_006399 [Stephania yunnanensis]|uniref:Uncharacterized protein n=1 Tax=Stephania yunnanensis TaxID=152371 RepID=A0AAP0PXI6_9MAGN